MKKTSIFIVLFTFISFSAQVTEKYKTSVETIFSTFKGKNYDLIKSILAPNVKVGSLSGNNDEIIPQVINQLPAPLSYTITDVKEEGENMRVYTEYLMNGGASEKKSFLFNREGKVIELDVLSGRKPGSIPKLNVILSQERIEVPFEVHEGLIYVKAVLNDVVEDFILDSGAPSIILNSDHNKLKEIVTYAGSKASGVGGEANVGFADIQSFYWSGLQFKNATVRATKLGHLSKYKDIAGLIGYEVFKDYQLAFDYKKRKITITKNKDIAYEKLKYGKLITTHPFEMRLHIPVFDVEIAEKNYKFGLDTGASVNLMNSKFLLESKNSIKSVKESDIKGVGGSVKSKKGKIISSKIGNAEYKNMKFSFEDSTLNALSRGGKLVIDGLLGYEFLKEHITIIDYVSHEIRIYKKLKGGY